MYALTLQAQPQLPWCISETNITLHVLFANSAGELSNDEIERIVAIIQNPLQFKIPVWFLNRKKDYKTGKHSQVVANNLQGKLREDLERLKKIYAHRGLRHWWGLKVRGQHTCTTGRRGRTVGILEKK